MKLVHTLPIGSPCIFFPNSNLAPDNTCAATVVGTNGKGILQLSVLPKRGGESMFRDCVRFVEDPDLTSNPESARRQGCWDYVRYQNNGQPPVSNEDIDRSVSQSLRDGMSPEQIVDTLKVPLKTVESIAKKIKV